MISFLFSWNKVHAKMTIISELWINGIQLICDLLLFNVLIYIYFIIYFYLVTLILLSMFMCTVTSWEQYENKSIGHRSVCPVEKEKKKRNKAPAKLTCFAESRFHRFKVLWNASLNFSFFKLGALQWGHLAK